MVISPPIASSNYNEEINSFPDLNSPDFIKPTTPPAADSASLYAPSKTVLQDYQRWLKDNKKDGEENERTQNMPHFDDPVGMHLLVETALGDSDDFPILSVEEVEELKKEKTRLSAQMESVRRKLALESKVRDAALSLTRLYTRRGQSLETVPTLKGHRSQRSGDQGMIRRDSAALNNTEDELAMSTQKCDELSKQMWDLDLRYRAVEGKLLRHTAGVLQATHAGPKVQMKGTDANAMQRPQPPDSPQSVYSTLEKTRSASTLDADHFDHRSYYRDSGQLDSFVERLRARQSSVYDADPDKPLPKPPQSAMVDNFALSSIASRLAESNKRLRNLLRETEQDIDNSNFPEPPKDSGPDPQEQMNYLDELSDEIERTYRGLASNKSSADSTGALANLWEVVIAHEKDAREWKRQQREDPDQAIASDEEPDSNEPDSSPNEPFSFDALSNKIRHLCNRATTLRNQQTRLRRTLHDQRALRAEAETRTANLDHQVREAQASHAAIETAADDARAQLAALSTELNLLRSAAATAEQRAREAEAQAQETRNLAPTTTTTTNNSATEETAAVAAAAAAAAAAETRATQAESELRALEAEVVRLTTELTVAKAELDGAYGSRAQRLAEQQAAAQQAAMANANNANNSGGEAVLAEAEARNRELLAELRGMAEEQAELVRQGVAGEREVDAWRERCEGLEARLAEERIRWLGVKSPGADIGGGGGGGPETTSTVVLKTEFKRMMRDTRAEHVRVLKVSLLFFGSLG